MNEKETVNKHLLSHRLPTVTRLTEGIASDGFGFADAEDNDEDDDPQTHKPNR